MDNNGLAIASVVIFLIGAVRTLLLHSESTLGSVLFTVFLYWLGVTFVLAARFSWSFALGAMVGAPLALLLIVMILGRSPTAEDPDTNKHT